MAKNFVSDAAILPLQKKLKSFCRQKGYTEDAVFEGLLDYMIDYLNPSFHPVPNPSWRWNEDENAVFHEMMILICQIHSQQMKQFGWYDPFGDLYMALHSNGGGKEQYFTPSGLAQLAAEACIGVITEGDTHGTRTPVGHRIVISDPAGGSGRMALAGYTYMLRLMQREWGWSAQKCAVQRPYIIVEDVDFNCVKMAALNITLHGAYGEAVCHDTLAECGEVRLGYICGLADWPFPSGIPSVSPYSKPENFVCTRQWLWMNQRGEKYGDTKPTRPSDSGTGATAKSQEARGCPVPGSPAAMSGARSKETPKQLSLW